MDAPTKEVVIAVIGVISGSLLPALKRWIASQSAAERARLKAEHDERQAEQAKRDRLWEQVARQGQELGELRERVRGLAEQNNDLVRHNAAKDVTIAELKGELARYKQHNDTLEEMVRELETEVSQLRRKGCEHREGCPQAASA